LDNAGCLEHTIANGATLLGHLRWGRGVLQEKTWSRKPEGGELGEKGDLQKNVVEEVQILENGEKKN